MCEYISILVFVCIELGNGINCHLLIYNCINLSSCQFIRCQCQCVFRCVFTMLYMLYIICSHVHISSFSCTELTFTACTLYSMLLNYWLAEEFFFLFFY